MRSSATLAMCLLMENHAFQMGNQTSRLVILAVSDIVSFGGHISDVIEDDGQTFSKTGYRGAYSNDPLPRPGNALSALPIVGEHCAQQLATGMHKVRGFLGIYEDHQDQMMAAPKN